MELTIGKKKKEAFTCKRCGKLVENQSLTESMFCDECIKAIEEERKKPFVELVPESIDLTGIELPKEEDYKTFIEYLIAYIVAIQASDLHLKTGMEPRVRKGSGVYSISDRKMTSEEIFAFTMKNECNAADIEDFTKSYDFSFTSQTSRFRCNTFHDINGWAISIRQLYQMSYDFDALGVPQILKRLASKKNGILLITGPTGSGKSTTLTCVLDYINKTQKKHIITIEDPIEYIHQNRNSMISQREVGKDTVSYEEAIVDALREDPDIIMIGEMRDLASIEAALRAAETGHLVLSTLHTRGSASTINRIVDVFPVDQQQQIRTQLSGVLIGAVTQQLVPCITPGKLALAVEIMVATDPIKTMIRDNKVHFINNSIITGINEGMVTMASSLEKLVADGKISEAAMREYMIK